MSIALSHLLSAADSGGARRSARTRSFIVVLGILLVALLAVPSMAFAKEYSMGPVDIAASVETNGDLVVSEDRTFDFTGDYTFVYWSIPTTDADGDAISIAVTGLSEMTSGESTAYELTEDSSSVDTRPAGTYYVEDTGDAVLVYAFFSKADESATFELNYTISGGVAAWADTGELYWQFIGDDWDISTSDISMTLTLPVPEGEEVTGGDNVRAWAHGPLNGEVSFNSDGTISFVCPAVGYDEFLEARVTFPVEWLSEMTPTSESKLDSIMSEEAKLATAANAERTKAQIIYYVAIIGSILLALGALAFSLWAFFRWGKEHKTQFQDQYFRDLPSDDHPAVLGALWRWGKPNEKDFTAALMHLTNLGAIQLEKVTLQEKGFLGRAKEKEEYLIRRIPTVKLTDPIDTQTVGLVFARIAGGKDELYFSDITEYAKKHAEDFVEEMKDWKSTVSAAAEDRGFFESSGNFGAIGIGILAGIVAAVGIFASVSVGSALPAVVCVIAAIGMGVIAFNMPRRSSEASELYARCEALRNWLRDFSRLKEAPPLHVKLWDHLLVMAVVFGVAEEVIAQLKVVAPTVIEDPAFLPIYLWCIPYGGLGSPATLMSENLASAIQLSTAQIAGSSMSSIGGGGGGFSGGGGGGFGGGGGGAG